MKRVVPFLLLLLGCDGPTADFDPDDFPHRLGLASRLAEAVPLTATRTIDVGTAKGRGHLLDGWSEDEVHGDDGSTFAWGVGEASTLLFVAAASRELTVQTRAMPYRWPDAPRQTVTVELDGETVATLELRGGMRGYRFTLPARVVRPGPNFLRLRYGYSRAPRDDDPAAIDARPLAVAWDRLIFGTADAKPAPPPARRGDDLFLPYGTQLSYFQRLDGATWLTLDALSVAAGSGRLEVYLQTDGDERARRLARLAPDDGPFAAALEPAAPGLTQVTLAAVGDGDGDGDGGLILARPSLRSASPFVDVATTIAPPPASSDPAGSPVPSSAGEGRPNVIVYLVDTLRADHLGCYGYPRPISPAIDAFAADAVLFTRAVAQSSWTRSAVASLFTGLPPGVHGVHGREDALAEEAETLAERLAATGYDTAAFITNGNADARFGLGQGFATFDFLRSPVRGEGHAGAAQVNTAALRWIERAGEPFFVYLHTLEPHAPYAPPAALLERLGTEVETPELEPPAARAFEALLDDEPPGAWHSRERERRLGSVTWIQALAQRLVPVDDELIADLTALYDAEIAVADRHFGDFLDQLRARGLYRDSIIVFLSDHGEELYDHHGWSHGMTLYQEQVHVPLIVRLPGGASSGLRVDGLAGQIDVLPTILDLLGLPAPEQVRGRSLLPAIRAAAAGEAEERGAYSHLDLDGHRYESLILGRHKLICNDPEMLICRLYDLETDPGEERNLAAEQPVLTGYLRSRLRLYQNREDALEAPAVEIDPELRERLRALGYL